MIVRNYKHNLSAVNNKKKKENINRTMAGGGSGKE